MRLPPFNDEGDMIPGVHRATLAEVLDRFGRGSGQRRAVANRLIEYWQARREGGSRGIVEIVEDQS